MAGWGWKFTYTRWWSKGRGANPDSAGLSSVLDEFAVSTASAGRGGSSFTVPQKN